MIYTKEYKVRIYDVEWDIGKCPIEDGYDLHYISTLPREETYNILGTDKEDARDYALKDMSDNWGFLIQGCKIEITEV